MKKISKEKKEIVFWSSLMHQKNLLSAGSGNVSYRAQENQVYITAHNSYLGFLEEDDIICVDGAGTLLEGTKEITSEKAMHLGIYAQFPNISVVLHAHSPFTVAYFNLFDDIEYGSFESKFYLGKVPVVPQSTPTVTDVQPVLEALASNNIVVLKNHGVLAMGNAFKKAYSLIELLEQQCHVALLTKRLNSPAESPAEEKRCTETEKPAAFELFSEAHMQRVMELVNKDKENQELGKKFNLTTTLAVKNNTNGCLWCFHYQQGKIVKLDHTEEAEFVISTQEQIWKKVFNRQIDPFVASTQGIIKLKGDFNKMNGWFPVFEKTFKVWEKAPVT